MVSLNRSKRVSEWFPNYLKVQSLFLSIKDFESGCRNFLNHFNEGLGNQQLVYSHEMLSCVVENQTLQKPGGINEFWVDFNMKSKTISFYYVNQDSEVSNLRLISVVGKCFYHYWFEIIFSKTAQKYLKLILGQY